MKSLIFFVLFSGSAWAQSFTEEARFLDKIARNEEQQRELAAEILEGTQNLDLKREARKIRRHNHRDLELINSWRSSYYGHVPPEPQHEVEREEEEGKPGDIGYIMEMKRLGTEAGELLRKIRSRTNKEFIETFARRGLRHLEERQERLEELRKELAD